MDPLTAPSTDPLSAPSKDPDPEMEEVDLPQAKTSTPPEQELKDTSPALPPRPEAPPPTIQADTPPPKPPPTFDGSSGGPAASTTGSQGVSSAIKPGRVISDAERAQLAVLAQHREQLKAGYISRRTVAEADKIIEDKVHSALQGRASVGMHGVKDLLSFVKGHADMEEAAAKNFMRFSTLFGQETGTTNDALLGYSSSCKSMQKLHSDLSNTLTSVELKRVEESIAAFEDGAKKVTHSASTMVTDLTAARDKVEKAFQAQEKAWADCEEADKHSVRVATVDSDPWLAGLRYQSAVKALDTVIASHGSDLSRLVQEMKAHDLKRLETMKSVLRSYAEARRNLVTKAMQNAEELCAMIEKIDPTKDSEGFVAAADISEFDLLKSEEAAEAGGTANTSQSALGVWIPDEAVRQCNRCNLTFGIMRRKHHCRRCGHVFCDKCSSRTAVLPQSFGFNQQPQRVCEACLELLQNMTPESSREGAEANAELSLEVLKEGPLYKKGGLLKSGTSKQRHFVCTRSGFLHYFESKFDPQPKGSICLHYARITNADDDACAFNIDIEESSSGGFFALRQKMSKTKYVLRTAAGSVERDAWVKVLSGCSNYGFVAGRSSS